MQSESAGRGCRTSMHANLEQHAPPYRWLNPARTTKHCRSHKMGGWSVFAPYKYSYVSPSNIVFDWSVSASSFQKSVSFTAQEMSTWFFLHRPALWQYLQSLTSYQLTYMSAPIANHEAQATNIKWSHGAVVDLVVHGFARLHGLKSVSSILAMIKEYTRISDALRICQQSKDEHIHLVSDLTWSPSGIFNNMRWTFHAALPDGWGISFPDHGIGICAAALYQGKVTVELTWPGNGHEIVHLWLGTEKIWQAKSKTEWAIDDARRFRMSLTCAPRDFSFCKFQANCLYLYCVSNSLFAWNDSTSWNASLHWMLQYDLVGGILPFNDVRLHAAVTSLNSMLVSTGWGWACRITDSLVYHCHSWNSHEHGQCCHQT